MGSTIPDKKTLICTLPILVLLENERFGGLGSTMEDVDKAIVRAPWLVEAF